MTMIAERSLAPADVWADPRGTPLSERRPDALFQERVAKLGDLISPLSKDFLAFQYARESNDHVAAIAAAKRLAANLTEAGPLARIIERAVVAARSSVPTKE